MKEAERKRKFNEFRRLSQEGICGASDITRKLGISINTLYNRRKLLRTEAHPIQQQKPLPLPSFSRVILEQKNNKAA